MKIHIKILLPTISFILHFDVSSSMLPSPSRQPTSPQHYSEEKEDYLYEADRPLFDKNNGELLGIYHNYKLHRIASMTLQPIARNMIPNGYFLQRKARGNRRGLTGKFVDHKIYLMSSKGGNPREIEPTKYDLVMDSTETLIYGMFGDEAQFYRFILNN